MTEVIDVINKAKQQMVAARTLGTKESRLLLIRNATLVEQAGYPKVKHMIDRCPGCNDPIPAILNKLQKSLAIAIHTTSVDGEEIVCGYGGESLELRGELPQ